MRRHLVLNAATFTVATLCQLLLFAAPAAAQRDSFTIEASATPGDRVVGGGRFLRREGGSGEIAGTRALNNRGEVVIVGDVSGDCETGMYLISGGRISPLGDYHCNPSPIGPFISLRTGSINDSGQVLVVGRVTSRGQPVAGLFLAAGGKLTKIVAEGDPTPLGTTFASFLLRPFPSPPTINSQGKVAFLATTKDAAGNTALGVFVYDGTAVHAVTADADPSPLGGKIDLDSAFDQSPRINDLGQLLFFCHTVDNPDKTYSYGYFLSSPDGIVKVVETLDRLPGDRIMIGTTGSADLNNVGDVAFPADAGSLVGERSDIGIYLYTGGAIHRIAFNGDATPIGGTFAFDPNKEFIAPRVNDRGVVAFLAPIAGGSVDRGLFLASEKAALSVVVPGDKLPGGDRLVSISSFTFNNKGQVAFFANGKKQPLGAFLALPAKPKIQNVRLRPGDSGLELTVGGTAMIANDAIIEIDGVALEALDYPEADRETGGTSARIISRDPRLDQLLPTGHTVQVTVYNSLTNLRSKPKPFTP